MILSSHEHDAFQTLIQPYQRELFVHCYRMLGSFEDAEDALQDTFLRAWQRLDTLKVQSSLRAWLYRIATNVSLDMIDKRKSRSLPRLIIEPARPGEPLPVPINDPIWLDPLPDDYIETREHISLAFLAILQTLPGRQRAILILRDVLGWRAQDVAEMLNITAVAVNSALQRARATMEKHPIENASPIENERTTHLLARYVQAWEAADWESLIALLREDAAFTMPPLPLWYQGRQAIRAFLNGDLFAGKAPGHFRLTATRANGCPAFAVYHRDENHQYQPTALHVLTLINDQIAHIDDFLALDTRLFSQFTLRS